MSLEPHEAAAIIAAVEGMVPVRRIFVGWCLGATLVASGPPEPTIAAEIPLCTADGVQAAPVAMSDGAGGAYVAWADRRSGVHYDIYAQHLLASGAVDPAWPADGLPLCTAAEDQDSPMIITDGAGGAIIAWRGLYSFGAHHILASGMPDPAWPPNGRSFGPGGNEPPVIAPDGAGGAIAAYSWELWGERDIRAQRILASGALTWGTTVCGSPNDQRAPAIIASPVGGAYIVWQDRRTGVDYDIYAQHILGSGEIAPGYWTYGVPISTAPDDQILPVLVGSGAGGALIAWLDERNGNGRDLYANHMLPSGSTTTPAGLPVCTAGGDQLAPAIAVDGAGGAIISWHDRRGTDADIYAHHLLASGVAVDGAWPVNGAPLCTAAGNQDGTRIVPDGGGGAFVAWSDIRGGAGYDVYAHHVLASGVPDALWPAQGSPVSTQSGNQFLPAIAADGSGGALIAWQDYRDGPNADVYAAGSSGVVGAPSADPHRTFALERPWPNPAREEVAFRLALPREAIVSIAIHDAGGRRVRSLASGALSAAAHTWSWDLTDDAGRPVRAGVYFVTVGMERERAVRRFAVLR